MSTKGTADVIFCLDASGSMGPCIEGVKSHIAGFAEKLSEVDKYEYGVITGLASINFDELIYGIGRSVSVSQTSQQSAEPTVQRELHGQSSW